MVIVSKQRRVFIPYGTVGEMSIYVNDILYDSVFNFKTTKYLDNVWTFEIDIPGTTKGDTDLAIGKIVKVFIGNDIWLRGTIETSKYQTYQITKIAGIGSTAYELRKKNLSQNEENKSYFEGKTSEYILDSVVSENSDGAAPWIVESNSVDTYPSIFVRADNENRLNAVINTAKAINYNWYESWGVFPYNTPTMNMAEHKGSETSTKTFEVSGDNQNTILTGREEDKDALWNDITVAGYGDGILQLKSRIYHATLNRTHITIATTKNGTETINVADTTDFPSSGDVWIGCEKITYTGKTGTTLTGITREVAFMENTNVADGYIHTKYAPVYDAQYTITAAETDSSIGDGTETNDANYSVHEKTITDNSIIDQDTLDKIVNYLLEEHKVPPISITLTPMEIIDIIPTCSLGDVVIINDPDTGSTNFVSRIVGIDLGMNDAVQFIELTCSNKYVNVSDTVQHIEEENRRLTQYMKGSPNIISVQSYENAQGTTTVEDGAMKMKFRIWDKTIAIQDARLDMKTLFFRAYTSSSQTASGGSAHDHSLTGVTSDSNSTTSATFVGNKNNTLTTGSSGAWNNVGTTWTYAGDVFNGFFNIGIENTSGTDNLQLYARINNVSDSISYPSSGLLINLYADSTTPGIHSSGSIPISDDIKGKTLQVQVMCNNAASKSLNVTHSEFIIPAHTHTYTGQTTVTENSHTHPITMAHGIFEDTDNPAIKVQIGDDDDWSATKTYLNSGGGYAFGTNNNIDFTSELKALVGDLSSTKRIRLQFEPQGTGVTCRVEANADVFVHLGST